MKIQQGSRGTMALAVIVVFGLVFFGGLQVARKWIRTNTNGSESVVTLPARVEGLPEFGYLADAVPATLSDLLTRVPGLSVASPPTSAEAHLISDDPAGLARLYDAPRYVAASVKAGPDRFAISLRIVETRTDRVVWSGDFAGAPNEYLDLMQRASEEIASVLQPQSAASHSSRGLGRSSPAELKFREGEYYLSAYETSRQINDFNNASAAFNKAAEAAPQMADAQADLALMYRFRLQSGEMTDSTRREMEQHAQAALSIDPKSSRALAAMGWADYYAQREPEIVLGRALAAIQANPRDPCGVELLGVIPSALLATAAMQELHRKVPLHPFAVGRIALSLQSLGRSAEGLVFLDNAPQSASTPFGMFAKAMVLADLGKPNEASDLLNQAIGANILSAEEVSAGRLALSSAAEDANTVHLPLLMNVMPILLNHQKPDAARRLFANGTVEAMAPWLPYDAFVTNAAMRPFRDDPEFKNALDSSHETFRTMMRFLSGAHSRGELPAFLEPVLRELTSLDASR